jgi:hypothetical protein
MNKDVIYIEPEEDITDIIGKIEGSKSKIVALVPPKKAGVFRSIVNIKLIAKTAANNEKTVVLVTTDSSIIKLAAATKMPVTKDLKSAPKVPEPEDEVEDSEVVDVDDEANESDDEAEDKNSDDVKEGDEKEEDIDDADDSDGSDSESEEKNRDDDKDEEIDDEIEDDKKEAKNSQKKPEKKVGKLANSNNPVLKWIGTHKKADIAIGAGLVVFVLVMIWMFVIAPAVTITLKLETVTGNFSENVSFTDKLTDEKVTEGKFYIEEKKIENKAEIEFEATGKKNVGEKASGELTVTYFFPINSDGGTITIKSGTAFTTSGKNYLASKDSSIHWDGDVTSAAKDCENYGKSEWKKAGCKVSAKVAVQAAESGESYNLSANSTGWSTSVSGVSISGAGAMTGGTDKTVTVVQQSDIDAALKEISSTNEHTGKEELTTMIPDNQFPIDSSFKLTTADPVSTPEVGKEVEDGKKAKLTVTTTATVFVIDKTKLEEFIIEKAKLEKGYKIYEMKDPFVENFMQTENGYVGKLKTSYVAGSTVTENDVVNTVKGKGIGTAKRDLSDGFDGIKSIDISTSVPWVTSVPGNPEKITVVINTESTKKEG